MKLDDYRNAPSGDGPLAPTWKDKPHRLVYDLCRKIEAAHVASEAAENLIVAALAVDGRFISGGFEDASPADRENLKQLSRAVKTYLTT